MLTRKLKVKLNERAVLFYNGLPVRALKPGRYRLWRKGYTEQRWDTKTPVFDALPAVRAIMPKSWFSELSLDLHERGMIFRDNKPLCFLRPGLYRYWTVDESTRVEVYSVFDEMPQMSDEMLALIPYKEYLNTTVQEHERCLEYVQGKFQGVLEPGVYNRWQHPEAKTRVLLVDMRRQQVTISGQDLMTRDKVTLRLSLTVEYAVVDPIAVSTVSGELRDSLYLIVQLAAREFVASKSLDELLESRDAMTEFLQSQCEDKAQKLGVVVERVGVKDVVLPGDMKVLLNRVIEAEKEAVAKGILRRDENAATRSMANTAKVIANHPSLMRLKELEAMKDIASSIQDLHLIVGSDGLGNLLQSAEQSRSVKSESAQKNTNKKN